MIHPKGKPNKDDLHKNLRSVIEKDHSSNAPLMIIEKKKPDYKSAMDIIMSKLRKDKEWREAWKAQLTMCFYDSHKSYKQRTGKTSLSNEDIRLIGSEAAEFFLQTLADELKVPEGR